mgnify:CR=1 FL=1
MVVAVNIKILHDYYSLQFRDFIFGTFRHITGKNPGHEFIFISDRKEENQFINSSNVKTVTTAPLPRRPLFWKIWYHLKLPAILKKYKADVFISFDGICSLNTPVPQCLILFDLFFSDNFSSLKKQQFKFYKKNYRIS